MLPKPWEVARTMTRTAPLFSAALLTLAGCNGSLPVPQPDPHPLAWSANYARPFEPMTSCLAQNTPPDYSVIPAIDQRQKLGGVLISSRSSGKKVGEFDVYRIDDNNSRVVFRSAIQTVGGSSYLEDQARQIADSCAM
jgi:hypothetical protein